MPKYRIAAPPEFWLGHIIQLIMENGRNKFWVYLNSDTRIDKSRCFNNIDDAQDFIVYQVENWR